MLQKLSSLISHALGKVAEARKRAAESGDPVKERLERFLANQAADQMLRQSTQTGTHRDKRDHSATTPGKRLISIVEDDRGVRESLGRLIVCSGYASTAFVTAEKYLESGLLSETACLICDVQLPGMSGPELQARLIADGHRIPIVFMTGNVNETTRARVLAAGAIGYLAKPLDPAVLIGCLEKVLASPSS